MTRDLDEGTKQKRRLLCQVSFRIVACAASAVAALVMAFNRETTVYGGVEMDVDYTAASAFEFLVAGDALVSVYCLLSLVFMVTRHAHGGLLHVLDMMAMVLAMGALAAAAAVAQVGKFGEPEAGWVAVCGYFPEFCNRAGVSLAMSFLGFASCFLCCAMQPVSAGSHGSAAAAAADL